MSIPSLETLRDQIRDSKAAEELSDFTFHELCMGDSVVLSAGLLFYQDDPRMLKLAADSVGRDLQQKHPSAALQMDEDDALCFSFTCCADDPDHRLIAAALLKACIGELRSLLDMMDTSRRKTIPRRHFL